MPLTLPLALASQPWPIRVRSTMHAGASAVTKHFGKGGRQGRQEMDMKKRGGAVWHSAAALGARGNSSEQVADSKAALRKALRRAHRAAKALRGQRLEELAKADPVAVFTTFRGRKPKAYDSVSRQRLWDKLAAGGMGGSWLRAVQALYADVPMARTQQAAVDIAQLAAFSLAGQPLEAVGSFKYLGITFHASTCLAGAAAPARLVAARAAMHICNVRCAALGVEAAPLQLRLLNTMVDAVLSYGSEVWGMQLAAASAAGKTSSTAGSKAERLHLAHLWRLLGVRQGTPTVVVLAEAGERPLWQRWLLRAAELWNLAVTAEQSSVLWQAMTASVALAVAPGHRIPASSHGHSS
ncbi:hypothetical protein ACK3TF_001848 [Chlorella vulgaris]